jgi:transposase InsO family protein
VPRREPRRLRSTEGLATAERRAHTRCRVHDGAADAGLGLAGLLRGESIRTAIPEPAAARASDQVRGRFSPPAPDPRWVADFTFVPMWAAWSTSRSSSRRILTWLAATSTKAPLVLDAALEQAMQARCRDARGIRQGTAD